MIRKTGTDTDAALEEACFELARTMKWEQKPIDLEEIRAHAANLAMEAKGFLSEALNTDVQLLVRAVHYLTQAHGMPMGENLYWFRTTLGALLEVARPNSGLDESGREFLKDMRDGINSFL
jgi:hypothetical protein